jgi:hypothetical protein
MIGWIALLVAVGVAGSNLSDKEKEYHDYLEDADEIDVDHRASGDYGFAEYVNKLWARKNNR